MARCPVVRLMCKADLRGVMRGKVVRTTVANAKAPCPLDRGDRQFNAQRSNQLWVRDSPTFSTWRGFTYVAFVINVFTQHIVDWRVSSSIQTDFMLDALEEVLYALQPERNELVHLATGAHHTYRSSTAKLSQKLALSRLWEARTTAKIMLCPRRSAALQGWTFLPPRTVENA